MKSSRQIHWRKVMGASLLNFILAAAGQNLWAQQTAPAVTTPSNAASSRQKIEDPTTGSNSSTADTRYRIGPGDVLDVRVARAPELSRDAVRVDQRGMIHIPMWKNDIPAACLTEAEVSQNIATVYLKYKRDPQVEVFVKEYQSQPVAVTGAVHAPSNFKLQRQVRLLEVLSFAGGVSDNAGQTIQIVHTAEPSLCEQRGEPASDTASLVTYKLSDTQKGLLEANPYVRPGDIVRVLDADQVYVVGNVLRPTAILLKEPITISRAIAVAGGTAPSTKKDRVRIIRQLPGSTTKREMFVDLAAIEKRKAEDIALLPNDIVDVPISGTKSVLRSLVGAIVPAVSQLPVRVIP
jgi:polysaccharide biosynthesis/export protein